MLSPAAVVAAAGGFVGITAGQFAVGVRHELLEHGVKGLGLLGRGVMGGSGGGSAVPFAVGAGTLNALAPAAVSAALAADAAALGIAGRRRENPLDGKD